MTKQDNKYKKLLDQWQPPEYAGKPIGCLTTTFTFSAPFFEEQCLSNFLGMDSSPGADGAAYLIEREEKMSGLTGAIVLADSLHCNESRNLRWDVISARVVGGVQHAKVTLLVWQNHIRIIIASANMTEYGYCKNQEVFGVLDYMQDATYPRQAMLDTLTFLEDLPGYVSAYENASSVKRWQAVIKRARKIGINWGSNELDKSISITPVFIVPKHPTLFEQIKTLWGNRSGVTDAQVTSPFFDADEYMAKQTVSSFTKLLNARGSKRSINWYTIADEAPDKGCWLMKIPKASREVLDKKDIHCKYYRVSEKQANNDETAHRSLHAKLIQLSNNEWLAHMCGSSNFTQRGTGLSAHPNIEANLITILKKNLPSFNKVTNRAWVNAEYVKLAQLGFGDIQVDDSELDNGQVVLHTGFIDASLSRHSSGKLELKIRLGKLPDHWKLSRVNDNTMIGDENDWRKAGSPEHWVIPWSDPDLPSLLKVNWDKTKYAFLPVNIDDASILPPPDELRDLSIEALIEILSSQGSLYKTMKRILKRNLNERHNDESEIQQELDPHKRVTTSHYLIPRTRRISKALVGMRTRLEKPVATEEALKWRLYGPIGVEAIINVLIKYAESKDELAFLIAELMLDISRVNYQQKENSLSSELYYKYINKILKAIIPQVKTAKKDASPMIRKYCEDVLNEVRSNTSHKEKECVK